MHLSGVSQLEHAIQQQEGPISGSGIHSYMAAVFWSGPGPKSLSADKELSVGLPQPLQTSIGADPDKIILLDVEPTAVIAGQGNYCHTPAITISQS